MRVSDRGVIFQVQRWSIHDGDGIRSTVFLKGCPLRCAWCANPESQSARIENTYGLEKSVDELMAELRRDEVFYRESGGGVTFSGGEPLLQSNFLRQLLKACYLRGYSAAIETSLYADWPEVADIFQMLDQVFVDLKHLDPAEHKKYTGLDNGRILANILKLLESHANVTVRMPLIAGVNDQPKHIEEVALFLGDNPPKAFEFMPYHDLGRSKYQSLGLTPPPDFEAPKDNLIDELKDILRRRGILVI